jgi:hypothetical protein
MNIRNFWVLGLNGLPLFSDGMDDSDRKLLLSGFLGAFKILADSVQGCQLNKMAFEDNVFYYYVSNQTVAVLEAQVENEVEDRALQISAQRLGKAFNQEFPSESIESWCGDCEQFESFMPVYKKICTDVLKMLNQSQREYITQYFAEAARDPNVLGCVVFDLERDEILASDIPSDISVNDFESFGSMLFSFTNRLGKQLKSGDINEILIRAQNYWIGGFKRNELAVFMLFAQDYFGRVLPEFVVDALNNQEQQ